MSYVKNWAPDPACTQNHAVYQTTATQSDGTWVYTTGSNGWGTFMLMDAAAKALLPFTDLICYLKYSSTNDRPIGFYQPASKVLVNTPTEYAVQVTADMVAGNGGCFSINGQGIAVRAIQWGIYTLDDWDALQTLKIPWFGKTTMPIT